MNSLPLSIITICRNEKDIERTCKSVAQQVWQDFEWIVVDGLSTDGTVDCLRKYEGRMAHFLSEPDFGVYDAMNKGIRLATGKYLLFLNGGDFLAGPNVLESVFHARAHDEDFFAGDIMVMSPDANRVWHSRGDYGVLDFTFDTIPHPAAFISRRLFLEHGLYCEKYKIAGDLERWITFFKRQEIVFRHIDVLVTCFNSDGISSRNSRLLKQEVAEIIEAHYCETDKRAAQKRRREIRKRATRTILKFSFLFEVNERENTIRIFLFKLNIFKVRYFDRFLKLIFLGAFSVRLPRVRAKEKAPAESFFWWK